jgi:hypothetical protein
MNYQKPEVALLGAAVEAVRSVNANKVLGSLFDGDIRHTATDTAYEADE